MTAEAVTSDMAPASDNIRSVPMPTTIFGLYWMVAKERKAAVFVMFVAAILLRTMDVSIPYVAKHIVDTAATIEGAADPWAVMLPWLYALVGVLLVQQIFHFTGWWSTYHLRMPLQAQLNRNIFAYVQRHAPTYFDNQLTGKIAYRTNICADQIFSIIEQTRWDFLPAIGFTTAVFVNFYAMNSMFATGMLVWMVLYLGICIYMGRRIAPYSTRRSEAKAHITGRVADSISNIRNVIYDAAHSQEDRLVGEAISHAMNEDRTLFRKIVRQRLVQMVFNNSFYILIFTGATYCLINHIITLGDFLLLTTLSVTLVRQIHDLGQRMPDFFDMYGSAYDSISTLIVPHALPDRESAAAMSAGTGEVQFDDISFSYSKNKPIFKDLSLMIPAGQKVGLVGHSGGGKSTFVNLMMRLYDVTAGRILINGHDVSHVTQESLRRQIALIPQDTILFHRTMRDNIRYARPEATDAEVEAAAQKAHAHEFIMELPKGYDTLVGERGIKLSGGQRQRIAIARAILKDAPILLLDEATSALDSESEALIQSSMKTVMQGKTVIAIAHRLSTLASLDRLLVLEKGKVVEDGTHNELLALGGIYAQLWKRQSGGFLTDV